MECLGSSGVVEGPFAGKPAPTGDMYTNVGANLLAMAALQAMKINADQGERTFYCLQHEQTDQQRV